MLSPFESALVVAIGLLLRFGLPLGLTFGLWWLLRRLDQRWQAEARAGDRLRMARVASGLPMCWEVRGCSPEMRAKCPAGNQTTRPCWQVMREVEGRLPERCFSCLVFRNAAGYRS